MGQLSITLGEISTTSNTLLQVRNSPVIGVRNLTVSGAATSDLHRLLAPVDDAAYTRGGPKAACLQGTREDVIGHITQCVEHDHHICWLNGPAGSGKSVISQTITELYAAKGRLGFSFSFL